MHAFMAQFLVKIGVLYNHLCEEIKSYLSDLRSSFREFVISFLRCNHAMLLSNLPNIHAHTTPKLQLSYVDQTIHIFIHIMHAMLLHVIYYCSHLLLERTIAMMSKFRFRVRIQAKLQAGVPFKTWYLQ